MIIERFTNYLGAIKGYSENTINAYRKDIMDFASWAKRGVENARWSTITRADIDNYVSDMVAAGLKPATTNRRLSSVSALYNYLKREGYKVENPCKYESRRKIASSTPNTIPMGELSQAYQQASGVVKVMIGLLATTGMRIQELLDLTWENIDFEKSSMKLHGKGSKERVVYTMPEYLQTLREVKTYYHPKGRVITMNQRQARYLIHESLKACSNAKQLSPHAIRHTYATQLAAEGVSSSTLGTMLGHNDTRTTQKYIDLGKAYQEAKKQIIGTSQVFQLARV